MNSYAAVVNALSARTNVLAFKLNPAGPGPSNGPQVTYWLRTDGQGDNGDHEPLHQAKLSYVSFTARNTIRKADGPSLGFMDSRDADKLNRVINDIVALATAAEQDKLDAQLALAAENLAARGVDDAAVRTLRPMATYSPAELSDLRTIADGPDNTPARRIARLRLDRLDRELGLDVATNLATGQRMLTGRSLRLIRQHLGSGTAAWTPWAKAGVTVPAGQRFTGWWATPAEVDPAAFEWFARA